VVKANAYGHGLLRAAAALGDLADGFALLDLDEAVTLREAGIRQPILLLEGFFEAPIWRSAPTRPDVVIHRLEQLQMLRHGRPAGQRLPIYLKLNSGMNRLGLSGEAELPAVGANWRRWRRLRRWAR
jgi:alanine racemase